MLRLFVGSKRYSSWSLRPYLALASSGLPFEVTTILLDRPTSRADIREVSPAGLVPVLHDGDLVISDSLAICEYVAELAPQAGLWPADRRLRAQARSIAAEMHSGFAALRRDMTMDIGAHKPGQGHTDAALADVTRITTVWNEQLAASGGPFLFGAFTIADAMFAPVATRFTTYGVAVDAVCKGYIAALAALPAMQAWTRDAAAEPQTRA